MISRFISYIRNTPWLKPIRNAGLLSLGRGAQVVCSLGYTALAARTLGVENFGTLALVHSFVLIVATAAQFSSRRMLIRYGAKALHKAAPFHMQRLIKFAFILNVLSTMVAFVIMILATDSVATLFGVSEEVRSLMRVYCLSVVFITISVTSYDVMSLFDRFSMLAMQTAVEPLLRFIGAIILFAISADIIYFLILWFISLLVSKIVLIIMAWRELKLHSLNELSHHSIRQAFNPESGVWKFVFGINLVDTLKLSQTNLPLLLIGWLLEPASAGLFRVAQQLGDFLVNLTNKLLLPAIFPEMSRLSAEDNHVERRTMIIRLTLLTSVLAFILLSVLVLFGEYFILLIAGENFIEAYSIMLWLAVAGLLIAISSYLESLMVSAGMIYKTFTAQFIATVTYVVSFYYIVERIGLEGAGVAAVIYSSIAGILLLTHSRSLLRKQ